MSKPHFTILPTDTRWPGPWHIEEGPDCLCSRCGRAILEHEIAIRAWPDDDPNRYSYRFHPACLGFQASEPLDLDDAPDWPPRPEAEDEGTSEAWLCACGHVHDGLHCPETGQQPPWGCPCSVCQDGEPEQDETAYGEEDGRSDLPREDDAP